MAEMPVAAAGGAGRLQSTLRAADAGYTPTPASAVPRASTPPHAWSVGTGARSPYASSTAGTSFTSPTPSLVYALADPGSRAHSTAAVTGSPLRRSLPTSLSPRARPSTTRSRPSSPYRDFAALLEQLGEEEEGQQLNTGHVQQGGSHHKRSSLSHQDTAGHVHQGAAASRRSTSAWQQQSSSNSLKAASVAASRSRSPRHSAPSSPRLTGLDYASPTLTTLAKHALNERLQEQQASLEEQRQRLQEQQRRGQQGWLPSQLATPMHASLPTASPQPGAHSPRTTARSLHSRVHSSAARASNESFAFRMPVQTSSPSMSLGSAGVTPAHHHNISRTRPITPLVPYTSSSAASAGSSRSPLSTPLYTLHTALDTGAAVVSGARTVGPVMLGVSPGSRYAGARSGSAGRSRSPSPDDSHAHQTPLPHSRYTSWAPGTETATRSVEPVRSSIRLGSAASHAVWVPTHTPTPAVPSGLHSSWGAAPDNPVSGRSRPAGLHSLNPVHLRSQAATSTTSRRHSPSQSRPGSAGAASLGHLSSRSLRQTLAASAAAERQFASLQLAAAERELQDVREHVAGFEVQANHVRSALEAVAGDAAQIVGTALTSSSPHPSRGGASITRSKSRLSSPARTPAPAPTPLLSPRASFPLHVAFTQLKTSLLRLKASLGLVTLSAGGAGGVTSRPTSPLAQGARGGGNKGRPHSPSQPEQPAWRPGGTPTPAASRQRSPSPIRAASAGLPGGHSSPSRPQSPAGGPHRSTTAAACSEEGVQAALDDFKGEVLQLVRSVQKVLLRPLEVQAGDAVPASASGSLNGSGAHALSLETATLQSVAAHLRAVAGAQVDALLQHSYALYSTLQQRVQEIADANAVLANTASVLHGIGAQSVAARSRPSSRGRSSSRGTSAGPSSPPASPPHSPSTYVSYTSDHEVMHDVASFAASPHSPAGYRAEHDIGGGGSSGVDAPPWQGWAAEVLPSRSSPQQPAELLHQASVGAEAGSSRTPRSSLADTYLHPRHDSPSRGAKQHSPARGPSLLPNALREALLDGEQEQQQQQQHGVQQHPLVLLSEQDPMVTAQHVAVPRPGQQQQQHGTAALHSTSSFYAHLLGDHTQVSDLHAGSALSSQGRALSAAASASAGIGLPPGPMPGSAAPLHAASHATINATAAMRSAYSDSAELASQSMAVFMPIASHTSLLPEGLRSSLAYEPPPLVMPPPTTASIPAAHAPLAQSPVPPASTGLSGLKASQLHSAPRQQSEQTFNHSLQSMSTASLPPPSAPAPPATAAPTPQIARSPLHERLLKASEVELRRLQAFHESTRALLQDEPQGPHNHSSSSNTSGTSRGAVHVPPPQPSRSTTAPPAQPWLPDGNNGQSQPLYTGNLRLPAYAGGPGSSVVLPPQHSLLQQHSASVGQGWLASATAGSTHVDKPSPTAPATAHASTSASGISGAVGGGVGTSPGKLGLRTAHIIVDANGEYREGLSALREAAAANQREVDAFRASKEALGLGKDGTESAADVARLQSQLMLSTLGSGVSTHSRGVGL
jgi:hypothetical protein